jgi:hypothetical protein
VDPTLFLLLVVITVAVVAGLAIASRRRRDAALEPTRLGPNWTPSLAEEEGAEAFADDLDRQVDQVAEETGLDRRTVETVLTLWREYLAVVGLARLPATHRYRLYDPYNPPVARRDAEGRTTPDRERVARDIGSRTEVPERDAEAVLAAVPVNEQSDASS